MQRVLLVEDDANIREGISDYITGTMSDVFALDTASDGIEGLNAVRNSQYDLLLLDIMLPGLDGFTMMREIRKTSDIPVIFLTARVSLSDRLYGYELGCDDYICKPFLVEELCAKIKNLLKRTRKDDKDRILTCGDITLDRRTLRVTSDGIEVELPPKEYGILLQLMQHADTVLTRDQLMDLVWGMDSFCTDRVVDNHVKNLRKLLGSSGKKIKSVYGRGYKITPV